MTDILNGEAVSVDGGRIVGSEAVQVELGIYGTATATELLIVTSSIAKAESAVRAHLGYDPVQAARTEYYPQATPTYAGRDALWEVEGDQAVLRRREEASTNDLQLVHIPVRAIVVPRVWLDYDGRFGTNSGAFGADDEKVLGNDFWPTYEKVDEAGYGVCSDGILKSFGRWPSEPGSVKVTYTAGYSAAEFAGEKPLVDASPIYQVVLEEALRRAKKSFVLWKKNAKLGHVSGALQSETLDKYRYELAESVVNAVMGATDLMADSRQRLAPFVNYGLLAV